MHVNQDQLRHSVHTYNHHRTVHGVFEDGEALCSLLLTLTGLSKSVHVVVGLALLVEEDGPALQVGVQLEHDQDQAQATGTKETGHHEVNHQ